MKLVLLVVVVFVLLGLLEHFRHQRSLRQIPIRIHVNGSRGKSSVTRLIAAGLRAGGIQTVAKTTGSAARYIHPDGSEHPVYRQGPPNIKEQIAVMRQAAAEGAKAMVMECMAIRSDLQTVTERKIVQSTIGVITNVRPDHLEIIGPTIGNVALALSNTIPTRGQLFCAEQDFAELFEDVASRRGSSFHLSDPRNLGDGDLEGFPYIEHAENVCLALDVCEVLGVPRETALSGMRCVTPDVGALRRIILREGDQEIEFVNAFAANDPTSTLMVWNRLGLSKQDPEKILVLINLRGDRMRRSRDLADVIHENLRAERYILIGDQTKMFRKWAVRRGASPEAFVDLGRTSAEDVYSALLRMAKPGSCVVGVGNIGGAGQAFLEYLESRRGQG
ncbi:MAG: poly-gamma-glutamate synthase PgsB [Candidatus Eisenbacteria sp.]|nr:poly-gamma-glutamate synthase PgsB [Candidatus Eisenbacteria bacterium]